MHRYLVLLFLVIFSTGCNEFGGRDNYAERFLSAENIDSAQVYASKIYEQGKDGIPTFLEVLNKSLDQPNKVLAYGKVNICLEYLHKLAARGIFIDSEIPVLFRALREQIHITDTLITANTLQQITGVEVGYTEDFVKNYTTADEPKRQKMIMEWEKKYKRR